MLLLTGVQVVPQVLALVIGRGMAHLFHNQAAEFSFTVISCL